MRHYLLRSRHLLPLLQWSSIQLCLPTPLLSGGHALGSMSVACRPPWFVGFLKQGSQYPHLGFHTPSCVLQLSRGLPTNLKLDHPLMMSSWTPSFLLFVEFVAVPIAVLSPFLALLTPNSCFKIEFVLPFWFSTHTTEYMKNSKYIYNTCKVRLFTWVVLVVVTFQLLDLCHCICFTFVHLFYNGW